MRRLRVIGEGRSEQEFARTTLAPWILKHLPGYAKVAAANQVIEQIGLEKLKARCRHFREWVERLEALGAPPAASSG